MNEVKTSELPRCNNLDGSELKVVSMEAGRFCEGLEIEVSDGERSAVYVPARDLEST